MGQRHIILEQSRYREMKGCLQISTELVGTYFYTFESLALTNCLTFRSYAMYNRL